MGRFRFTDDDSSSSDEEDMANVTTMPPRRPPVGFHEDHQRPVKPPRQQQPKPRGRKATPFRSSLLNFSMDDLSQSSSAADNDNAEDEEDYLEDAEDEAMLVSDDMENAEEVARAIMGMEQDSATLSKDRRSDRRRPHPQQQPMIDTTITTFEDMEGEEEEDEPSFTRTTSPMAADYLIPTREELAYAASGRMPSICDRLQNKHQAAGRKKSSCAVDVYRRRGRSFRVGWHPNGSFCQKFAAAAGREVWVANGGPQWSAAAESQELPPHTLLLLEAQRAGARPCAWVDNCPLYALLGADSDDDGAVTAALQSLAQTTSDGDAAAKPALVLLSNLAAACRREDDGESSDKTPMEARRMAAAYGLLLELCAPKVEQQTGAKQQQQQPDPLAAVFAALSGGNMGLACELAADAGWEQLALALASGAVGQPYVMQELAHVAATAHSSSSSSTGNLSSLLHPTVLRALRAAGGDGNFEDQRFRTEKDDPSLDWRQRLVLRILQNSDGKTLSQTLQLYERDILAGTVPFPKPDYLMGSQTASMSSPTSSDNVKSLFYRLLQFCADPTSMSASEAINPSGYTPVLHDFALSFHLLASICATKLDRTSSLSEYEVEYILNGFEAQLVNQGQWEWAVFVSLCQIGPACSPETQRCKVQRAKNLVLRHFGGGGGSQDLPSSSSLDQLRRDFLQRKLRLPSQWFDEALCYRAAANGNTDKCIEHALAFEPDLGHCMLSEYVLPGLFFDTADKDRMKWIVRFADNAPPDSVAWAMDFFVHLEDRIMTFSRGEEEPTVDDISAMRDEFAMIQEVMEKTLSKRDGCSVKAALLCPTPAEKVHLSSMACELLHRLRFLKLHLDSISLNLDEEMEE